MSTPMQKLSIALTLSTVIGAAAADPSLLPNIPPAGTGVDLAMPGDVLGPGADPAVVVGLLLPAVQQVREINVAVDDGAGLAAGVRVATGDVNGDGYHTVAARGKADILIETSTDGSGAFLAVSLSDNLVDDFGTGPTPPVDPHHPHNVWAITAFEADGRDLLTMVNIDGLTPLYFGFEANGLGDTVVVENGVVSGSSGLTIFDVTGLDFDAVRRRRS
ncbi:MAG: hypothetical protein CMJ31_01730 [Phycisphaerae bacterium]|nr:hypothetical protein [Phycisphaerae bacterium]